MLTRTACLVTIALALVAGCHSGKKSLRSHLTVKEAVPRITPGMTVVEVQQITETKPVMVKEGRFQWRMRDGSIWTDYKKVDHEWTVTKVSSKVDSR
jgi:hypothetical protein